MRRVARAPPPRVAAFLLLLLLSSVLVTCTAATVDVVDDDRASGAVLTPLPSREALLAAITTQYAPRPTLVLFTHDTATPGTPRQSSNISNNDDDEKDAQAARAAVQRLARALPSDYLSGVHEFVVRTRDDAALYHLLGLPRRRSPALALFGATIVRAGVPSGTRYAAPPVAAAEFYMARTRWWEAGKATTRTNTSTNTTDKHNDSNSNNTADKHEDVVVLRRLRAWALSVAPRRYVDAVTWRLLPSLHYVSSRDRLAQVVEALHEAAAPPTVVAAVQSGLSAAAAASQPQQQQQRYYPYASGYSSDDDVVVLSATDRDEEEAAGHDVVSVTRLPRVVVVVYAHTRTRGSDELLAVAGAAAARSGGEVVVLATESERVAEAFGLTQWHSAAAVPYATLYDRLTRDDAHHGDGDGDGGDDTSNNNSSRPGARNNDAVAATLRRARTLDMRDVAQPTTPSTLDADTATAAIARLCGNDNDDNKDNEHNDRARVVVVGDRDVDARLRRASHVTPAQHAVLQQWHDAVQRQRTSSPLRKLGSAAAMHDLLYTLQDAVRVIFVLRQSDRVHFARYFAIAVDAATRLQQDSCVRFRPPRRLRARGQHGSAMAKTTSAAAAAEANASACHTPQMRTDVFWLDAEVQDDFAVHMRVRRVPAVMLLVPVHIPGSAGPARRRRRVNWHAGDDGGDDAYNDNDDNNDNDDERNNAADAAASSSSSSRVARPYMGVHILNRFDLYSPRNDDGPGQMPQQGDDVQPAFPASADELLAFLCSRNFASAASFDARPQTDSLPRGTIMHLHDERDGVVHAAYTLGGALPFSTITTTTPSTSSTPPCRANFCYEKTDYKYYHMQPSTAALFVRDDANGTVTLPRYTRPMFDYYGAGDKAYMRTRKHTTTRKDKDDCGCKHNTDSNKDSKDDDDDTCKTGCRAGSAQTRRRNVTATQRDHRRSSTAADAQPRTMLTSTMTAAHAAAGGTKSTTATAWHKASWRSELEQRRAAKEARVQQKATEAARQREAAVRRAANHTAAARKRTVEAAAAAAAKTTTASPSSTPSSSSSSPLHYVVPRLVRLPTHSTDNNKTTGAAAAASQQQQQHAARGSDKSNDAGSRHRNGNDDGGAARKEGMLARAHRMWLNDTHRMVDAFVRRRANSTGISVSEDMYIVTTLEAPPPIA